MNELEYVRVDDYYLPNIALSDSPHAPPLGKYGRMHKEYLRCTPLCFFLSGFFRSAAK